MRGRRLLAMAVCAAMVVLGLPMVALGVEPEISINGKAADSTTGKIDVTLHEFAGIVTIPLFFNNNTGGDKTISSIVPASESGQILTNAVYDNTSSTMLNGKTALIIIESTVLESASATSHKDIALLIYYSDSSTPQRISFNVQKNTPAPPTPTPTPDPDPIAPTPAPDVPILLMLSPIDASGAAVLAPSGNAGSNVRVHLPILNRGGNFGSIASQIMVTPEISASLDSFPFVVEAVDYSRGLGELRPGEIKEVAYNFKLSDKVTSGVKEVKFNCVYFNRNRQEFETAKFSVFVTVVKGYEGDKDITDGDGEVITTQPKLIIESSTLTPNAPQEDDEEGRLYAGEPFTLKMSIRNTSSEEAVKNIQVTLSNDGNVIIPANNGSNSLYIASIAPGESVEREVKLQSAPDAEPKSQNLTVKFAYESSKTLKGYQEQQDIAVPILQRVRVRMNDPIIYGDGMLEQPASMSLSVFNLSKSTLYYCSIEIEGDNLRMEEPFYYGNVGGGGSMQADFNIIPSAEGNLDGKVILIFEDAYNKQTRLEKPFTLYVMESFQGGMEYPGEFEMPGMVEEPKRGLSPWLIAGLSGAGIALAAGVIVTIRRKKRKKELTDSL